MFFLQRKGGRDSDGPWGEKGVEERERGRERTLCNFLCWIGSLGEKVVISVMKKKDCMICTDMSEFCNMLEEKEKENQNEEKESTNTCRQKEVYL